MFPFDLDDDELELDVGEDTEPLFADYEIDFATNKLTGRIIYDLDCIKQWCVLAINTERYSFSQYSWDYGCEINNLLGKSLNDDYLSSELNRMLEECLVVDGSGVNSIEDVSFEFVDDNLSFSFRINTEFGDDFIYV